jgi:hypothetical protein
LTDLEDVMGSPKFKPDEIPFDAILPTMPQFLQDIIQSERAAGNRTDVIVRETEKRKTVRKAGG